MRQILQFYKVLSGFSSFFLAKPDPLREWVRIHDIQRYYLFSLENTTHLKPLLTQKQNFQNIWIFIHIEYTRENNKIYLLPKYLFTDILCALLVVFGSLRYSAERKYEFTFIYITSLQNITRNRQLGFISRFQVNNRVSSDVIKHTRLSKKKEKNI